MKVAFVSQPIDYIAPQFQSSSIGIWTDRVIQALEGKAIEVIIYSKSFPQQPTFEQHGPVQYRRIGADLDEKAAKPFKLVERALNYPLRRRPFFATQWSYLLYGLKIARDLRRQKADIIHIHNYSQLVTPIRMLNPQARILLHMHCEWLTQLDPAMISRRLAQVDLISGCSDFITHSIQRAFPQFAGRCHSIYNGVDHHHFSPDPQNGSPEHKDCQKLLFVGRVSPEKGIHILLQAFEIVGRQKPEAYLDVIGAPGDAPYEYIVLVSQDPNVHMLKTYYHGLTKRGGYYAELQAGLPEELARRVHFSGYVAHRELVNHYRSADVLVNPSLSESFGMSLIEAMSCRVPVVATRVGGMEEIVTHGETGCSVRPNDPQALAEAILQILEDDEKRRAMGEAGHRRVLERYTWDQVSNQLWQHYQDLARRP